jgi:two-component system, response regulator
MESKRILLVEDDVDDVELITMGLRKRHLLNALDVVRDGAEALDYLYRRGVFAGRTAPDPMLILLDLKMPRVDGREVLRQIKGDQRLRGIPVVVLTSSAQDSDIASGYALGANAYVVKPVEFQRLVEVVGEVGLFWVLINRPPLSPHLPT